MWKTYSPETHIAIWSVIGLFLFFSILEGILEQIYPWMPYQKLYAGSGQIPSLQNKSEDIELQEFQEFSEALKAFKSEFQSHLQNSK